jgi:hypothetical protein
MGFIMHKIGERVQIDHMTVTKNGITFKHFQAWERKSKYIDAAGLFEYQSQQCQAFPN